MPTLVRIVVILLVLVGLAYGAMFALVVFVQPGEKEVTVRIPARDLVPPAPQRDPLVMREIDTSRTLDPSPPAAEPVVEESPAPAEAEGGDGVVTLSPGVE